MNRDYTFSLWRNKKIRMPLFFLCLSALIVSCGGDENAGDDGTVIIDSSYLTSTTHPPVPYPIQIEDDFKIKVGELFGYEDVNWNSVFTSGHSVSNPEIIDGEGTICTIADDVFSVFAESPGSCSVKYPSKNSGTEGFIFLTITVTN